MISLAIWELKRLKLLLKFFFFGQNWSTCLSTLNPVIHVNLRESQISRWNLSTQFWPSASHLRTGSEYLLIIMCQVTRYPAVYPLHPITAKLVVKALTQFISVFGIPLIVQSDKGSNFTSNLFGQVLKQLHNKHNLSSAYHAQSLGALERFHQTLKSWFHQTLRSYKWGKTGRLTYHNPNPDLTLLMAAREAAQ